MSDAVPARGNLLGKCIPARYILAILGTIGMSIIYGISVCISVTMITMLNHTAIALEDNKHEEKGPRQNADEICKNHITNVKHNDGPFTWGESLQGTILSAYYWGYIVTQIPGAMFAENFSAKYVFFFAISISIICTLLIPILTKLHYGGLIAMRILNGLCGGSTFPAMHCLIARWSPPNERSIMSTIIYSGIALGTTESILLSGFLASTFGWESVFYVIGGLSCIWLILWLLYVQDTPNKQALISLEEREFINSSLGISNTEGKTKRKLLPLKEILKSVPFWAILIAHTCSNFGWYLFLIEIPFYVKQILRFDISTNGAVSALPYCPLVIFSITLGKILDTLRSRGKITTGTARKTATIIASLIPLICLLILCSIRCHEKIAVAAMFVGITAMGAVFSGFLANHVDIAPNYAGSLMAITNTVATTSGILVPIFAKYVTKGNQTISAWRKVFFVAIALFTIEIIVFTIFGSGEEQKWNNPSDNEEK